MSATRASARRTGWQAVKIRRRGRRQRRRRAAASRSRQPRRLAGRLISSSTADFALVAVRPAVAPKEIDRAILRGGHEPGARVVRNARLRPLLERGDEDVLRELLGQADVALDPRDAGDEARGLDAKDRADRGVDQGVDRGICLGGLHGPRSQHALPRAQGRRGCSWGRGRATFGLGAPARRRRPAGLRPRRRPRSS